LAPALVSLYAVEAPIIPAPMTTTRFIYPPY
jgi:hypothetical protein